MSTAAIETWVPIPGWEGLYEVSDQGHVRSLDRTVWANFGPTGDYCGRRFKGQLLTRTFDGQGYPYVTLCRGTDRRRTAVHALVLAGFVGPRPDGMETLHRDGNNSDPRLQNLRYGTRLENARDSVEQRKCAGLKKTHCKNGHPLSGDNVYIWKCRQRNSPGSWRQCRTCKNVASQRYKARLAAKASAALLFLMSIAAFTSPSAKADPVSQYAATAAPAICQTLDSYPTLSGVSGVLQGIRDDSGFTSYQAGQVIVLAVDARCSRHLPLLQRYADTFAPTTNGWATV